jgi:hypothetical protein
MLVIDCRLVGRSFGDCVCTVLCPGDCGTVRDSLHMGKVDSVHCLKSVFVLYIYIYIYIFIYLFI